jgi:hypothetical protein
MAYFDSTTSFDSALSEVEHLLQLAKNAQARRPDYLTYIKASLVLLGAKFEAFAENIVENYVDRLVELSPRTRHLSTQLRAHSTSFLLNQCANGSPFSGKIAAVSSLKAAALLWENEEKPNFLSVSNKFSYGKHGSSELRLLFQRIGIQDILTDCLISNISDDTTLLVNSNQISIMADVDSFTNIRNNIIHSDSSPGNITHQQIHLYKEKFWEFGYSVDLRLERELTTIKTSILSYP